MSGSPFLLLCTSTLNLVNIWPVGPASSWLLHPHQFFYTCFFFFNWRIIALQYCASFCSTSTWINHRSPPSSCVYVFVLSLSHILLFCNPMNCSPPGSSVHGISQARIQEWVAISFSRRSSWLRDHTWVSCLAGGFFTTEPTGKSLPYFLIQWDILNSPCLSLPQLEINDFSK